METRVRFPFQSQLPSGVVVRFARTPMPQQDGSLVRVWAGEDRAVRSIARKPSCSELRGLGDPFALAVESVVRSGRVQRGAAYRIGAAAYESTNVFHA